MQKEKNTLKIAWLFPDILFLHGERGNVLAFERVAGFADLNVQTEKIDFSTTDFEPKNYDIIFCPPGEITSFPLVIEWLKPHKNALVEFIQKGKVLFVTGTSQCIFGNKTVREDGSEVEGLGLIDCDYAERKYVYGDDICFKTCYGETEDECFGVQVQMMNVESREKPFGELIYGFGNSGKNRAEGVVKYNSVFTNVLGPILVLNPWLTKAMVKRAKKADGIDLGEFEFDMELERKSLASKKAFALSKKTNLTNCK